MSTIPKDIMDKIEEAVNIYTVGNHVSAGLAENILLKGYALAVNKRTEDINEFYKNWCKDTKRNGGILIGSSIKELLTAFGYQLATDGREELEKENAKLKKGIIGDLAPHIQELIPDHVKALEKQITALQSSLKEKEKECEELRLGRNAMDKLQQEASVEVMQKSQQIEELKAENGKLIMLTRKLMLGGS